MRYVLILFVAACLLARLGAAEPHPSWIWAQAEQSPSEPVRFARSFQIDSIPSSAQLRFAPVSANLRISIDGQMVASAEPHDPIQTVEIERRLNPGRHVINVEARGVEGPSALFVQLDLQHEDQTEESIVTDESWRMPDGGAAKNLGKINSRLVIPESLRVGIDVADNYEQWKQALTTGKEEAKAGANPAAFLVAPGFQISLVRSALPDEDSWVSMALDPQGRIIIAKEKRGLLRMVLSEDGSKVTKVESIDETLEECRGLAFLGDDLYANANNSKGLYRLRKNANGFATPELLFASSGGVGHGRNDLAVGPDRKLYSIHGDSVDLPTEAIDYTSPFRDARRGKKTSEGHLLRIDPESGDVELLTAGLRNPFGIDFNSDGESFTYDADAEYDMGSPWYRPTRVSQLLTGGDYGWRGVTKQWPSYYPDHPDNTRPNLDIGKGSPTAVKFGTRSNFPARYRDSLFILDWAYGRIVTVHMVPRGSSYLMTAETFLKGRPLNVTDLDFGLDGSMYLVTGGRKTQSALYRVRYVGDASSSEAPASPWELANGRFANSSRLLRRQLEAELVQPASQERLARIWNYLSHGDPWIRHAALNVIERHPIESWQDRAFSEQHVGKAVQVLTALARAGEQQRYPAIMSRLNEILPAVNSTSDRLAAFYAYWMCFKGTADIDGQLKDVTRAMLSSQYPSESYAENRLLSELLVSLGADDVVPKTIRLLRTSTNQTEQMHYLYVLRNVRDGWSMEDRRAYFAGLAQAQHYRGGAGMSDFLRRIREEAVATLDQHEREQLGRLIEQKPPSEELVDSQPRPLVKKWKVEELVESHAGQTTGDPKHGADVFASAACIKCHRFGTRGTLIGPDLTAANRRFNRRDLLVSIIEPSKVIAENYRSLQIVTTDGKAYMGQVTTAGDYRSPVLRLATDPTQPLKTIEIEKNNIESQKFSDVSWMPEGLMDAFTKEEILDLIAYLEAAR